jgi:hypothetical protein
MGGQFAIESVELRSTAEGGCGHIRFNLRGEGNVNQLFHGRSMVVNNLPAIGKFPEHQRKQSVRRLAV